jgi:hypothetical protein
MLTTTAWADTNITQVWHKYPWLFLIKTKHLKEKQKEGRKKVKKGGRDKGSFKFTWECQILTGDNANPQVVNGTS